MSFYPANDDLSTVIPLAIFHCDIIKRRLGRRASTVLPPTRPKGVGDWNRSKRQQLPPGKSDLSAAQTDAANNQRSADDYVRHLKQSEYQISNT